MESNNGFNFIDGFNLSLSDLKYRLSKMGFENSDNLKDFNYYATLYNDILNSKDFRLINKIKNILDKDTEKDNFSEMLNKKRTRANESEKKEKNGYNEPYGRGINSSNNYKNGHQRNFNSESINKYPSEDKIVKSFLEKQENQPFIFTSSESVNYDHFLNTANKEYARNIEESNMQLRNNNNHKINLIQSNIIHKSESEQTIKNGGVSNSNNKYNEMNNLNNISKPLKEEVSNFTAPLSRRQSEKNMIKINNNSNTNIPLVNQQLKTPSNSNKNLINLGGYNNNNDFPTEENMINLEIHNNNKSDKHIIDISKNFTNNNNNISPYEKRFSNNNISSISNNENNKIFINPENPSVNFNRRNSYNPINPNNFNNLYNNNNNFNINNNNNLIRAPYNNNQNKQRLSKNYSNNNISQMRNLISESALSKTYTTEMKSRSNPLLQYVTIGIKSTEDFKRLKSNENFKNKNSSSSIRRQNSAFNFDSSVNAFSVSNPKTVFEKGIFIVKDNYKTIVSLFIVLFGGAIVFKLYWNNPNLFSEFFSVIKNFLPESSILMLENYFNAEYIKENIFTVCILTAVLIGLVFLISKYKELTKYNKIALEDYKLIKGILESSRNRENNSDLIGLFKNNFIKENSEKHKINEEIYRKNILPLMDQMRNKEDKIEEGEIVIQDQAQKVWRLKRTQFQEFNNDDIQIMDV